MKQLMILSKYAHMAFVMYRIHKTAFMTAQLFADTQATMKNVMFCVAKQQILDGMMPMFLTLFRDDRLENLFGRVRTSDHSRNFDSLTLSRKLSIANTIVRILSANPDLNPGHKHLDIPQFSQDHINIKTIVLKIDITELTAMDASLLGAWKAGAHGALEALSLYGISANSHYADLLRPSFSLMQPFGNGKHPGVSSTDGRDESIPEEGRFGDVPTPGDVMNDDEIEVGEAQLHEGEELAVELEDLVETEEA
jgi:hypothetical protein